MVCETSVLLLLGICGYEDFIRKQIDTFWLAVFASEGILYQIVFGDRVFAAVVMALLPGCCVLVLSYAVRGAVGQGDGMLLVTMGIFLDAFDICMIFLSALFLSAGYALFLYYIKKKDRNYEIAFVPFLLAAYLWSLCRGNT